MEKFITATGKTIDLAIEAGLTQLGMDRDSVSVEILETPKSGFFGIGASPAKVKLTYEIGESYISNEGSEYAKNCVDLQGIKRYNIFRYFEELNMLLPVATEFDEENNTLFAETDELGTYCVLDLEVLLQTLE